MPDNNQDTTTQTTNPPQAGAVPAPQMTDSGAQPDPSSAPLAASVPPVATATPADATMPADSPIVDPLLTSTPLAPTERTRRSRQKNRRVPQCLDCPVE